MSHIFINTENRKNIINKNIYGHFSEHLGRCIYHGIFVNDDEAIPNTNGMRNDVVTALRNIRVPVLRWPGGCFADEYHWKDGIGPKGDRKKMINTHWGGVTEDNSFGTHEFMELCEQVGCEPYVNGNVGSGTVQEMSEWIEYITSDCVSPMSELRARNGRIEPWKLKYFGVGNENWGCGGNMRPEYYADLYRRYQTYVRNYGDNKIYRIACGPSDFDYVWMETLMSMAARYMDGISLHYYTITGDSWEHKGSATDFSEEEYYKTLAKALRMDELLSNHERIMNRHDPDKRIGMIVDEWGTWHDVELGTNPGFLYQQNTMRDALVAAATLNIFNRHSERVVMANIAQTVNVLQAVILTEGGKMVMTPTYHVFDLYKSHQDATLVESYVETKSIGLNGIEIPNINTSASIDKDGVLHVTMANMSAAESYPITCEISKGKAENISGRILSGRTGDYNDFEHPHNVQIKNLDGIGIENGCLTFNLPACSVAELCVGLS